MNWSYIAGYLDGEGHVGLHPNRGRQGTNTLSKITTLCWYNSHRDSLQAMRDFMGVGFIGMGNGNQGKGKFPGSKKPVYVLRISRKLSLIRVIDEMLPDLLVKREACLTLRQHLIEHVNEKRAENFGKLLAIPIDDYTRWYFDEGKSLGDIAQMLQATPSGVGRIFRVHKIALRPAGGSHLKGTTKSPETKARMKASRATMWEDPEFRAAQIANMQEGRRATGYKTSGFRRPSPGLQGENHPMAKLTDAQRAEMCAKYATGTASLAQLGREYGVSKKTVLLSVQGKIHRTVLSTTIRNAPEDAMPLPETTTTGTDSVLAVREVPADWWDEPRTDDA